MRIVVVLAFALAGSTAVAWASWSAPGAGSAAAGVGSMTPATLSVPASATTSVTVTWTAQASLTPASAVNSAITYVVQRKLGAGAYADISTGPCTGAKPYGTTSCSDSPPASGSYTYRAVATFRSWTATSADAGPVNVTVVVPNDPPVVSSIVRAAADPTAAATLSWTVTFSENVTGVDAADFALVRTGTLAGGAVTTVTGLGATYTVTATTGTGSGTLRLDVVDDDSIKDVLLAPLGGTGTGNGNFTSGQAYTIDRIAPTLSSLQMLDSNANGKVDQVRATFSETLASSTLTTQWTLANVPSGGTLASVATSGAVATLTLTEGAGAADTAVGSFTVALAANASGIRDTAGNTASFAATAPADVAAPAQIGIVMYDIDTDGKVDYAAVTFSETLTGVGATGQWTLANVPSAGTLASVTAFGGTAAALALNEGAGAADTAVGSFTVALAASASGIRDAAGNQSSFAAIAPADAAKPVRTAMQMLDVNANGKVDRVTATFSEALAASTLTTPWTLANVPSGGTLASVATAGAVATLTLNEGAGAASTAVGSFTVALAASAAGIRDAAANQSSFTAAAPTDAAAPARLSMAMTDVNANGKVDRVTATFSETLLSSILTGQWTLANVPSGGTLGSVATSGAVATLTITEGAGAVATGVGGFTLALAANAGGIRDAAGNQASFAATAPSDGAVPLRTAMQMLDATANGKIDRVTVSFSETLASSTLTTQWTLANVPSTGTLAGVATSGAVATLTLTEGAGAANTAVGTFTVALAASATGIRDAAGNQASFAATAPTDAAGPVPIAVSDSDTLVNSNNGTIQNSDWFRIDFSEAIASGLPASTPITESTLAGGNARLTITGVTNGALDMGSANYVTGTASVQFNATGTLSLSNTRLQVDVGSCASGCGAQAAGTGTSMVFVAAPALLDAAGNGAAGSIATGFRIF